MRHHLETTTSPEDDVVVAGDWNIAPTDIDVWDPAAFAGSTHVTPEERAAFGSRFDALSREMGFDMSMEEWVDSELGGTENFEAQLLLRGKPTTPQDFLEIARMRHAFEREGAWNAVGNAFMDTYAALGGTQMGAVLASRVSR